MSYVRIIAAAALVACSATWSLAAQKKEPYKELYRQGVEQAKKNNPDEAIRLFGKALSFKPAAKDMAVLYYARARAFTDKDLYAEALADVNRAIEARPDFAEALNYRGMMRGIKKGQEKDAAADFRKACDLGLQDGCRNLKRVQEMGKKGWP